MDKIKTLSAAIRYGSTFIGETQLYAECRGSGDQWNCGCAVGTAYLATISNDAAGVCGGRMMDELAVRFAVPRHIVADVSWHHFTGRKNRAQCADWLEARGY